jgi:hypothetical protein
MRYIQRKEGRVRVGQVARRFKLAPSNVSRGLRRRGISLQPTAFPWAAGSKPNRPEQVQKCRQALALYFLGLNPHKIERLLPIKSGTIRSYLRALTTEAGPRGPQLPWMSCDEALASLTKELEKAYGLGEHVENVIDYNDSRSRWFSADASAFRRAFRGYEPLPAFLMRKLRQILRTKVCRHGRFFQVAGRDGRLVKVRAPRN